MVGAGSSRVTPVSPKGPPKKRAQHEEGDTSRGKDKETILIKEEEERGGKTSGDGIDTETRVPAREVPWAPEVCHYVGRLIHHADNASSNIETAFGLLRSYILPRDARAVKGYADHLTGEIAQVLLNVSCYCSLFIPFG